MRPSSILVLMTLVAASCDQLRTASGDYGVNFADFTRLPGSPPFAVLEGTQLCKADPRCGPCDEDPPICESVALAIEGTTPDASGCHIAELGAPLTLDFTPQACTTPMPAESLVLDTVALAAVSARFDPDTTQPDETNDPSFPIVSQGAVLPDRSAYVPLQLLADTGVKIGVQLVEGGGRIVGWNPSQGALELQPITAPSPTVSDALPELTLTATSGARASAAFKLAGQDLPLADVLGVGPEAVQELKISALFYDGADGQYPVQVEAQARDADGKQILGVPIEWRILSGNLVIDLGEDNKPAAAAGLLECLERHPEGDTRSGTIEASYGDLRATLDVTWKAYTGPETNMNAGACDEGGCGCRSDASGGWAGLGLALLMLRRRRRSVA